MHSNKRPPIGKLAAKCPFASGLSSRKNSIVKMVVRTNCSMALGLLIVASLASATTSTTSQQASKQPASTSTSNSGVTQSYSEAIKWSFGGWEPLSQQQKALRNATHSFGHHPAQQIATNHHHLNMTRPIGPMQPPRQSHQGGPELLSESASGSQNNVHFATGQQQKSFGTHEANQLEQASRQLQTGPAYAMQSTHKRPQEFSFPAPAPIVREQLLPAAPDHRDGGSGGHHQRAAEHRAKPAGPHQQHFIYPIPQSAGAMHVQPSNNQHQHQAPYQRMPEHNNHHHHQSRRPQFPMHHHTNRHEQFMREMERRHKQHMMSHQRHQHQHMMMMRQQQYRNHKMQQQQQHENRGQEPAVRHALMQAAHHQTAPQNVATFKVIEDEQPVVFSAPQQLEAGDRAANRPNSSVNHQTAPYSQMAPHTAMAAIEKDHLNYNQAMQQVSNSLEEHQRGQTSNNIQDVKQRQINNERRNNQQQQQDPSKQRYLTIPVAVETAGDKVLTPDDINEIEKHVINVLPDLGTADKLVKLADSQLDLAHIKSSVEQARKSSLEAQAQQQPQTSPQQNHQQVSSIGPAELHQMNYEEHKSTMRQLENLARPTTPVAANQYQQSATSNPAAGTTRQQTRAHSATSQAASAPAAQHQSAEPQAGYQFVDDAGELVEPQYYAPAGPAQEVEPVDSEQMGADYNLIKNDLLQNIHYEPTRARPAHGSSSHSSPMQTASTPPMPHTATGHHQHAQANGHSSPATSTTTTTVGIPTVTRYFHQGPAQVTHQSNHHSKPERNNLFGRLRPNQQRGYQTASTRTILGGRKVSEVMRPLVHTTPVPLTSPMHIPSVEPEKVDAIQFIAGNTASDKQPVVVEAHQLVTHTPDGGIDYSTGGLQQQGQSQQQQSGGNQTYQLVEQQQQAQQQQFYPQANPNEESQGAIIEYVSISDQALSNALANQHQQQPSSNVPADSHNQQQSYEMSSTPEGNQQVYSNEQPQQNSPQPPLLYAYSTQQQQQHETQNQASTPTYSGPTESPPAMLAAHHNNHHQQQQEPSLAAWSPSIASEHQQQQQQLELSGQSGPMQQLEFPATAGYNLFGQQQQDEPQSMSVTPNYANEQQDQQQQQEPEQDHHSRWRTKAGGRQPNPDAQYDGQMVKATQADGDDDDESQQQEKKGDHQIQQVMMIDDGQQPQHYQTTVSFANQQHPAPNQAAGTSAAMELQQQHERVNRYEHQQHQPEATGASQAPYRAQGSTTNNDGFDSTSAYVGGAQMNHQTPSGGIRYSRPPQSHGQTSAASSSEQATSPFGYTKLDRDHQQQHLEQQRVEHQSQLAELMDQQQRQQQYQTTTPMSATTVSEQQQSRNEQEVRQEQEQPNQQVVDDSQTALLISADGGHQTLQMPAILDQQSLIHDQDQNGGGPLTSSDDAGSKQRHHQPIFQVYQAYYAPKDHKPLPGYVRLSLEEFNHLFKDAEIQFVDKNARGLAANLMSGSSQDGQLQLQRPMGGNEQQADGNYDARSQHDHMRASGSELQSIVVDRRSIADRRSSTASLINSTMLMDQEKLLDSDKKLRQLGQAAVKKIISIANSRQAAVKQQAANKLVMKRVQAPILTTPPTTATIVTSKADAAATPTTATSSPSSSTDPKPIAKKSVAANSAAKTSQNMPKKKNPLSSSGRNHSDGVQRDKAAASKKKKPDEHKKQVVKV